MSVTTKRDLLAAEDAGWLAYMGLLDSVSPAEMEEPGYIAEGWTVKDLVAHVAAWQAEAGSVLEQLRMGTYQSRPMDVDAMNQQFLEANRDQPLSVVRSECASARTRMITEFNLLAQLTRDAEEWFVESGAGHYAEHIPRLRDWVAEVRSR